MTTSPQPRPRSTGFLQLVVCVVAFILIALIFGHLNSGGLDKNGDQLTLAAGIALVALLCVLRLQHAADAIERSILLTDLQAHLNTQDLQGKAIERTLGHDGFLARLLAEQHAYDVSALRRLNAAVNPEPAPVTPTMTVSFPGTATTGSSSAGVVVTPTLVPTDDPRLRGTTGPSGERYVGTVTTPAKKAPAKRAPAKKAAAKKAAAPVRKAAAK